MKGNQQMNPLIQPLVAGFKERVEKEQAGLQALQAISKKIGTEYTRLVQQVNENDIVKKVARIK
jgi:hypothetical protein